jgi:hypothetical protein
MPHVRGDTNFGACTLSEPLVKYTNIEIARQKKKKKKGQVIVIKKLLNLKSINNSKKKKVSDIMF